MRGFFRFIFGFIFIISAFLAILLFSLKTTVFTYQNIQNRLTKYNVYERLYSAVPEITKLITDQGEAPSKSDNFLSGEQIGKVITESVTPAYLEQKITSFLSGFYDWLYGKGTHIPEISFTDIKSKMENYAAQEQGVPVEFIRSGMSGFSAPERFQIQPNALLLLLRRALSSFNLYMLILIVCAIVSLAANIATGNDGMVSYIKRPIGPFWGLSVITSFFVGFIWLFFNAGNLLTKLVAEKLGSAPIAMALTYDLLNSLIVDFVKTMFVFAAAFLVSAIILEIVAKIIKRREAKKIQEEQIEK